MMHDWQGVLDVARALADETRLRLLVLLLDGDATVSELAVHLGLAQPRVSTHLAILKAAGFVTSATSGRQRVYRVDADRARLALAGLQSAAPTTLATAGKTGRSGPASRDNTPVRRARTCYDHLAGVVGVQLLDELLQRNWLTVTDRSGQPLRYGLTAAGVHALHARGVDLNAAGKARRLFAYGCLDWSERRPHLGGALGAAIFDALTRTGFLQREASSRAVTPIRPLRAWLDGPAGGASRP